MANEEHLQILQQSVKVWNLWRETHNPSSPKVRKANLSKADLREANLSGTNFDGSSLQATIFADTNLKKTKGLNKCRHLGPSIVNPSTLRQSGPRFANILYAAKTIQLLMLVD